MIARIIAKVFSYLGLQLKRVPAPAPAMTYQNISLLLYFKRLLEIVKDVDGDIVECGVGRGNSLAILAFLLKDENKRRNLWGFDSFEGFPEISNQDRSIRNAKKGEWGDTSIYQVRKTLLNSGLDNDFINSQITLVKGFFTESLPKYTGTSIAFLHLDVDLYDSYLTCLRELYPKLATGGIVLFDEYMGTLDHLHFPGAQKAIDEYFANKKSSIQRDAVSGKYYLVKREP